jgi:hypothetical protein
VCIRVTLALAAAFVALPGPARAAETVEGHVFHAKTGAPLRGAQARLVGPYKATVIAGYTRTESPRNVAAQTDASGAFVFRDVEPGNYALSFTREGFEGMSYGSVGAANELLPVTPGNSVRDIAIKLKPCGAIEGRVVDEEGRPLVNARISLYLGFLGAWLARDAVPGTRFVYTDDLGRYRAFGIHSGSYVVSAAYPYQLAVLEPLTTPGLGHKTTYYPDAASPAGARPIAVANGETATADFTLRRSPVFRLRGYVKGVGDAGRGGTCVGIVPAGVPLSPLLMVGSVGAGSGGAPGSFDIVALPPGRYTLTASCADSTGRPIMGTRVVDLAADLTGVTVDTKPAWRLRATLKLASKVDLSSAFVLLERAGSAGGGARAALPASGGEFAFDRVWPGHYVPAVLGLPSNCYVRSILYGGKPVPAKGFEAIPGATLEISLGRRASSGVNGGVVDGSGRPAPYPMIVAMPSDGAAASITEVVGGKDGRFRLPAMRPGRYRIAALENLMGFPGEAAREPGLMKLFESKSVSVAVPAGSSRAVRLTIIGRAELDALPVRGLVD